MAHIFSSAMHWNRLVFHLPNVAQQEVPDFVKTRAVQPTEVPETTFLGELIGWTEHLPHQANHEEK